MKGSSGLSDAFDFDPAVLSADEKRALLARLLTRVSDGPRSYPLSFAQQRLWFLDRLTPGSPAYNIPGAFRLEGALDIDALAGAISDVVARHATLRTVFTDSGGRPSQTVEPAIQLTLPIIEAFGASPGERENDVRRRVDEDAALPFDLRNGPVFRVRLFRLAPDNHVLLVVMHHICADGWSLGVFNHDLAAAYAARVDNAPSLLALPDTTYVEFAQWQRGDLSGARLEGLLTFWKERLAGLPALDLPLLRPRPAIQRHHGGVVEMNLSQELVDAAKALARTQGATLFCVLMAAFHIVMARLSGQSDFAVATPVANRRRTETEDQIGFFVNTLCLRTDIAGARNFREVVDRVSRSAREAQEHQDLPFELLVEGLQVPRDTNRNPLVQVLFALQSAPMAPLRLSGLAVSSFPYRLPAVRFDLELHLWDGQRTWTGASETQAGLTGSLFFNRDVVDSNMAADIADMTCTLLAGGVARPDADLADLTLLSGAALREILGAGCGEPRSSLPASLGEIMARAVGLYGGRAAICDASGAILDYAALFERADRIRAGLESRGLRAGATVALQLERGPDLACAMLAALRGGFTFVLIDPNLPPARMDHCARQAGAVLILAAPDTATPQDLPRAAIGDLINSAGSSLLPPVNDEQAPLYIVFTSGSSGQPKGVAMPRPAFANLIAAQSHALPQAARTLLSSAVGFDVVIQEIFHTLATGGTLITVDDADRRDPERLGALMARTGAERAYMPYALVSLLLGALARSGLHLPALREIVTAGEQPVLTDEHRRIYAVHPGLRLINQYGPAETHVVSEHILDGDPAAWPDMPPAGRAVPGCRLHILDAHGRPVPFDIPGELHIGGVQVAAGYVGAPGLTSERFVADPFDERRTARLYRTGDRASLGRDGVLRYLGRCDDQVKIRGFRVEPGEVEALLAADPTVQTCRVVAETGLDGTIRLVGYIVPRDLNPTAAALRDRLRPYLPDYMIPSAFAVVPALSLSANGKLDREALAGSAYRLPEGTNRDRQPSTPAERTIALIWCDVLGRPTVDCDSTFFDHGGNSLLIVQACDRLRVVFPDLSVTDLFQFPTIDALARHLTAPNRAMPDDLAAAMNRGQRQRGQLGRTGR